MNRKIKVFVEISIIELTDVYQILMEDRPFINDMISLDTFLGSEARAGLSADELSLLHQFNIRIDGIDISWENEETVYYCYASLANK